MVMVLMYGRLFKSRYYILLTLFINDLKNPVFVTYDPLVFNTFFRKVEICCNEQYPAKPKLIRIPKAYTVCQNSHGRGNLIL